MVAMGRNLMFQQIKDVTELVTHFQNQQNLLAFFLGPVNHNDILKLTSSGLLEDIYFFAELPQSTRWLDNTHLRLDSKYGHVKQKNEAEFHNCSI